ncbi:hypothetical protein [Pseudodesulfovibrio sp.]|uniref:hypothetical protein n=1 Tax=unclassified Pseudodesulfovibrio TaxID=2661612 RepID=UPI003AFFA5A4
MSSIEAIDSLNTFAYPDSREVASGTVTNIPEQMQSPQIDAREAKQDWKTSVQEFHYTGKGACIDDMC